MRKALFTKNNKCMLCPHNCKVLESKKGLCGVRVNKKGVIGTLNYNNPSSLNIDPIEKKPLYHFNPGKPVFSIGGYGCNFFCSWCQNSSISKEFEIFNDIDDEKFNPRNIVLMTKENGCDMIAYTYNEPTVFYEYMIDIAKLAKKEGIKNVIVSNGYINKKPLKKLCKYIDAANIDLKFFNEKNHLRYTSGKLSDVLDTLKILKKEKVHVEITNLIIPSINDDMIDFEKMCAWIKKELGKNTPLHISRFYPHYKMKDLIPTPVETMNNARNIACKYLDFVYVGNLGVENDTICPKCKKVVILRRGYEVFDKTIKSKCFSCKTKILFL